MADTFDADAVAPHPAGEPPTLDDDLPSDECSGIEDVMGVVGRAWAGAVVEALLADHHRFREIARAMPGVTDSVLSARLKDLCAAGLAQRRVEPGPPTAVSYHPTDAARDLAPVLRAVRAFALTHPEVRRG